MASIKQNTSLADEALLRYWISREEPGDSVLWRRFAAGWAERLRECLPPDTVEQARQQLQKEIEAQRRLNLRHVHPSWWVRALQEESPALRVCLAACGPASLRGVMRRSRLVPEDGVESAGAGEQATNPHPDIVPWVRCLWAERLIGDLPSRPSDSLVVRVLASQASDELRDLVNRITELKRAFLTRLNNPTLDTWNPKLAEACEVDLQAHHGELSGGWSKLGVLTVARLLWREDAFRARWALQHLPYHIAKAVRSRMPRPGQADHQPPPELLILEENLLRDALEEPRQPPPRDPRLP